MNKFTFCVLLPVVVISAGLSTNIALCQSTLKNNETNTSSNGAVTSGNFVLDKDMFVKAIAEYETAVHNAEGMSLNEKNNKLKEARDNNLKKLLDQIEARNKSDTYTADDFCFLKYIELISPFSTHSSHKPNSSTQNALTFSQDEFPSDSGSNSDSKITSLCTAIINDNYGISLSSKVNSIEWLNELLEVPSFYDIVCVTKRIPYSEVIARLIDRRALDNGSIFTQFSNNVKRLNRILLEAIYPDKIQKPRIDINGDGAKFETSNLPEAKIAINELLKALKGAKNGDGNMLSTETFIQLKLSEVEAGLRKSPFEIGTDVLCKQAGQLFVIQLDRLREGKFKKIDGNLKKGIDAYPFGQGLADVAELFCEGTPYGALHDVKEKLSQLSIEEESKHLDKIYLMLTKQ